jgi:hypothetical protein
VPAAKPHGEQLKRCLLLGFLIAMILFMAACGGTSASADGPKTPQALQPPPVASVLFQVVKPDGSTQGFTWDNLKKLPLAQVTAENRVEEGVKLMDVLNAAGITEFSEVSLTGSERPVTLRREQIDDNTILDFTNHGTVKLATIYVAKADWTKDITEIKVK